MVLLPVALAVQHWHCTITGRLARCQWSLYCSASGIIQCRPVPAAQPGALAVQSEFILDK
jgi:hypothetical protein